MLAAKLDAMLDTTTDDAKRWKLDLLKSLLPEVFELLEAVIEEHKDVVVLRWRLQLLFLRKTVVVRIGDFRVVLAILRKVTGAPDLPNEVAIPEGALA